MAPENIKRRVKREQLEKLVVDANNMLFELGVLETDEDALADRLIERATNTFQELAKALKNRPIEVGRWEEVRPASTVAKMWDFTWKGAVIVLAFVLATTTARYEPYLAGTVVALLVWINRSHIFPSTVRWRPDEF